MSVRIITGNALVELDKLPKKSVHCVITSPPYWGLRDYGHDQAHGLEASFDSWLHNVTSVFRKVHRVLRDDGTCWINMGDSYASSPNGRKAADVTDDDRAFRDRPINTTASFKPKQRIGQPHRLIFALQEWGWYWRDEIIWHKPNPMPSSVQDRTTPAHEFLFMLTKQPRYFYDQDAIREEAAEASLKRWAQNVDAQEGSHRANAGAKTNGTMKAVGGPRRSDKQRGHSRQHAGFNDRWDSMTKAEQAAMGRNKRSVWPIATKPFKDAHFATFPPDLVKPCILASTSARGCCHLCGAPYRRITENTFHSQPDVSDEKNARRKDETDPSTGWAGSARGSTEVTTTGWQQTCSCEGSKPTAKPVILDPYAGAGTTGLVADQLQRDAVLIEVNPAYAAMARDRISAAAPMFAEVSA